MCGIATIYRYASRPGGDPGELAELAELARMCDDMACRGPDAAGVWVSPDRRVAMGHRRLSIIDLSTQGAQPMATPDGEVVITYNGEIYNYRALRSALESRGHQFRSASDTEVLLHLYLEHGEEMFAPLRGMYALALYDARKRGLLLARDPFGIKPLYVADDGSVCRVASEVKALLRTGSIDSEPDPAGHAGFFLWGHVPEPHTLYKGISALEPGTSLWLDARGGRRRRVFADVAQLVRDADAAPAQQSQQEAEARVADAVRDSVKQHLVADVDVGVFLSAGLDSTVLASIASEQSAKLKTVTLGFTEFRGTSSDETVVAERVARQIGADHQTIWVREDDFRAERARFIDRMDQPTIDGLNSYFVARAAAQAGVKVALSGLGGDELFGGYPSFRQVPRLAAIGSAVPLGRALGRVLRVLAAPFMSRVTSPKYAGLLEYGTRMSSAYFLRKALYMPWELSGVMDADLARSGLAALGLDARLAATVDGISSTRLQMTALETVWYMRNQLLRDADWASMSHSVEVRVPFVDVTLWMAVLPLIANARLCIDKQVMARSPERPLPMDVLSRPKTGFSVPTRDWLLGEHGAAYGGRRLRGWARYVYERAGVEITSEVSEGARPDSSSLVGAART
jgi:asparagine synthase (glutamine-hydrolysing)